METLETWLDHIAPEMPEDFADWLFSQMDIISEYSPEDAEALAKEFNVYP